MFVRVLVIIIGIEISDRCRILDVSCLKVSIDNVDSVKIVRL